MMLGSFISLALMVGGSVILAVAGLLIVRKYVSHDTLIGHHDVAGYMLSIIGTLYAIVLGLIVVNAMNTFEAARSNADQEANALHNVFHIADALPAPYKSDLRKSCLDYAKAMVEKEWPAMQQGKMSPETHQIFHKIVQSVIQFKPHDNGEDDLHQALLSEVDTLNDLRHTRLTVAEPEFDTIIWAALLLGGVVLVVFTYFFGVERLSVQIVMTAMVTFILGINLTLVGMFGYPYSGDVHVSARPFSDDMDTFSRELKEGD